MATLLAQIGKLTPPKYLVGIAQGFVNREPIIDLMDVIPIEGLNLTYNREGTDPNGAVAAEDGALSDATVTFTQSTRALATIYQQATYSGLSSASSGSTSIMSATEAAIAHCVKGVAMKFKQQLVAGTGASNQLHGIKKLAEDESRDDLGTSAANGQAISLALLRELRDNMNLGISAYIMSYRTLRSVQALLDAAGGTTSQHIIEGYGPITLFDGTPIFPSDNVAINETQGSSSVAAHVHAVYFSDIDGFAAIVGNNMEDPTGRPITMGFKLEPPMALEGKDNYTTRVMLYANFVAKSKYAVGSLKGITN